MKKYQIIYADPPWRYNFSKSNNRKIEKNYPTMTLKEICNLKIPSAENSVLYLWATAPKLLEALKVMDTWGFIYKTNIIWDKCLMGMGYWCRGQHEILLIGTKGKFSPPKPKDRISSIIRQKRSKHSKKPSIFKHLINQWFPHMKKIELFAREKTEGWDVWGDEVESDIDLNQSQDEGGE